MYAHQPESEFPELIGMSIFTRVVAPNATTTMRATANAKIVVLFFALLFNLYFPPFFQVYISFCNWNIQTGDRQADAGNRHNHKAASTAAPPLLALQAPKNKPGKQRADHAAHQPAHNAGSKLIR